MVEWKKLGDICEKTSNIKWKDQADDKIYKYIDLSSVSLDSHKVIVTTDVCKQNAPSRAQQIVCANDVLLGTTRPTLKRYCQIPSYLDKNICSTGFCIFRANKEYVLSRWLFHNIGSSKFWDYCELKQQGAGYPCLSNSDAFAYMIPIPSIEEQNRIVGILDTFTASIDNLKEQIAQRRKQYEFYRDQLFYASKADLLEASKRGEVIVKSLDDLGTFTRGRRFVRTDIVPEGVPCIHYGDMYTYYGVSAEETPTHLTKELSSKLRFAKNGDVVIVAAGENDLDIGVGVAWLGKEPVVVHDACFIFENKMNPKYLSHFMRSRNYHQQIRMGVVDGKICSISAKELGRALIAVPSLQEQQRIVDILDTFEASIQNLEAQLSQREKQYDYYRNKLLTFE